MSEPLKAAKVPCGSCPYRKDVPSGIWEKAEYDKLLMYDQSIIEQLLNRAGPFMCHQNDGHLCAGWLACHRDDLATLRMAAAKGGEKYDPSVYTYETKVPVFSSGAEARAHGIKEIKKPKPKARKMIAGLIKKRGE